MSHAHNAVSGDELDGAVMPASGHENVVSGIPKRGRPKAAVKSTATKATKAQARRISAGSTAETKKAVSGKRTNSKRAALAEITNIQAGSDTEEVDEFDDLPEAPRSATKAVEPLATQKAVVKPGRPAAAVVKGKAKKNPAPEDEELPETHAEAPAPKRGPNAASKKSKQAKHDLVSNTVPEAEPETQPESMEIDDHDYHGAAQSPLPVARRQGRILSSSKQRNISRSRRAGSASDSERAAGDITLRRRLSDMTLKFEALEVRYQNLEEIGVREAAENFDRLKKQTDERLKAANELISSLKADLAAQNGVAAKATTLERTVSDLQQQNAQLATEAKTTQSSLNDAHNEAKALQVKLSAARAGSAAAHGADPAATKAPGSAAKPAGAARTLLVGSAEAAREAQKRALKEELYRDLTGLIIRDVKRGEGDGDDVFDCIQTGRNGSLHFHLAVPGAAAGAATAYEDAELQYTPFLDANRDRDLVDILPDYLSEEICFERRSAGGFYGRLFDRLTKKVEVVVGE